MTRSALTTMLLGLLVVACASTGEKNSQADGIGVAVGETRDGLGDALLSPAEDLNFIRDEIPDVLVQIKHVYSLPDEITCEAIATEVNGLTAVLGPDDDVPTIDGPSRSEKMGKGAADLTLGAVSSATTDFIPFRSIVRRATGASAYEKRIRLAYQRGLQRRSFLKGVGSQVLCLPPAAPLSLPSSNISDTTFTPLGASL
ncbi:MAG: hypothetical protein AAF986_10495 [Pseudomonadota bacterium]